MKRKHFIHSIGATTLGALSIPAALSAAHSDDQSNAHSNKPPKGKVKPEYIVPQGISNAPHNEAFWGAVATNFIRPEGFINLENGYFSHQPQGTLHHHIDAQTTINTQTSHFMRTAQTQAIEEARKSFALTTKHFGAL